jgi:hypothetical protein
VIGYLENRVHQMPYDKIIKQDLELGSGAVEGAVKNIIGKRCDHGGMRWIEERVEAVVQVSALPGAARDAAHRRNVPAIAAMA